MELPTFAGINIQRYAAVLRISESLSTCRDPQTLARIISDQLDDVLSFEHLDLLVLKEDSKEIEWHTWGKGPLPFPDLPVEERLTWHVHNTQEPLHIFDWNSDPRVPQRLRQILTTLGINIGSVLRVPLTTPHRRLGTLGIVGAPGVTFSSDDVAFLRDDVPAEFRSFPKIKVPKTVRHPGGFTVSGAPVGTFLRSALLLAGQKAFGNRYAASKFYERVETDLAMRIMRSHFHGGTPKGAFCCKQCTLAVLPVLEANAIRYFDGRKLAKDLRHMIHAREWRFSTPANEKMQQWALN